MGLIADIGSGRTAVDTAIFIYFMEENPRFLPVIEQLFEEADAGARELVTSALTLLEVLVIPYRVGDRLLAERYEQLLTRSRGIRVIDLSREQMRGAAELRAATGVKTPDALQLIAAMGTGCGTFVTNDRRIPGIPGMRILQLADYVSAWMRSSGDGDNPLIYRRSLRDCSALRASSLTPMGFGTAVACAPASFAAASRRLVEPCGFSSRRPKDSVRVFQRPVPATLDEASIGAPCGIRTRVPALRGPCPRPLDEGSLELDGEADRSGL